MSEVTIIGIDLAKRVFQLHGTSEDGSVVFRKKLSRGQILAFIAQQSRCVVAMEACATAHGWGREFEKLGHDVRLIPPVYLKPFVKRQKNDAADAEAIVEAALRPNMRFVAVKTEDQQARAMLFRTRRMFVGQRTQMINALRGHLAEHGLVAATGTAQLKRLADAIEDSDTALPEGVRDLGRMSLAHIATLNARVAELDQKMRCAAKEADVARRLQTMPGVGRLRRLRSRHSHRSCHPSGAVATLQPGSGSCQNSIQQAAKPGWARRRRWDNVTSASSWSQAPWLFCRQWGDLVPRTMAG